MASKAKVIASNELAFDIGTYVQHRGTKEVVIVINPSKQPKGNSFAALCLTGKDQGNSFDGLDKQMYQEFKGTLEIS